MSGGFGARQGWRYGLLGLPLAFVALPLYVILPNHYAREFSVPLGALGLVLLGARLLDALIDPLLGRFSDRLFARSVPAVLGFGGAAALLLAIGFALLFFPATRAPQALLAWAALLLLLTYAAYSGLSIAHQSWGAMLGGDEGQRSRIVAWREGFGLVGVLVASITPVALGLPATVLLFWLALVAGLLAWARAPAPQPRPAPFSSSLWQPFKRDAFRRLLLVFVLNGVASALPATLILFFVQDRLQAPKTLEPVFLGSYFACAALALPLWLRLVRLMGLARTWLCGMLLSLAAFLCAAQLGAGDSAAFIAVCALSGVALGTDLALPGALLAGVIAQAGDRGHSEGAYFGWWNFATKLNLALAAGGSLPLLAWLGYTPGVHSAQGLQALAATYCLLPCVLKGAAALALYAFIVREPAPS